MHRAGAAIVRRASLPARQLPACSAWPSIPQASFSTKDSTESKSGGFFSSIFQKLQDANPELKESVENLKSSEAAAKAKEAASKLDETSAQAKSAFGHAAEAASKAAKAASERVDQGGKAREAYEKAKSSATGRAEQAKSAASEQAEKASESAKAAASKAESHFGAAFMDVMAGVLGMRRAKRAADGVYPWIEWQDPESGKFMYKNVHANVITDVKPIDFDEQMEIAEAEGRLGQHKITMDAETATLSIIPEHKSRMDVYSERLMQQPIMQSLMHALDDVKESEIGQRAAEVKAKVSDKREELQEKWETSQHPLVYNASYAVDAMFSESDQGRGMREMLLIDKDFDEAEFLDEMQHAIIPQVVDAFLRGDRSVLRAWCTDEAMEPLNAVLKAREAEKLTVDPTVLAVGKVDFAGMRPALKGAPPLAVVTSMVQQIHCMKDKEGNVVEGGDNEVRAVFYFFAMQREWSPVGLTWRVAEMSMAGSLLYL